MISLAYMKLLQYLIILNTFYHIAFSDTFQRGVNVQCGDIVNDYFNNTNDTHIYNFTVNSSSTVTFHTCYSDTNIVFHIVDDINVISKPYCYFDDYCGKCMNNNTNHIQNFTMPIHYDSDGTYQIWIWPYYTPGQYQINIECSNFELTNIFHTQLHCESNIHNVTNSPYHFNYHLFALNQTANVLFDSFDTSYLFLFDTNFNLIHPCTHDYGCYTKHLQIIPPLSAGNYILGVYDIVHAQYTILVNCNYLTFHEPLYCNNNISDQLQPESLYDANYHLFTLNQPANVLFDSCRSSYDTYLHFYDIHFTLIQACDDCGECHGLNEQLQIFALLPGNYILSVGGYNTAFGQYNILVNCYYDYMNNVTTLQPTNITVTTTSYYTTSTAPNRIVVDSMGIDTDYCGNEDNPCGTIAYATYRADYNDANDIKLYVKGQNIREIKQNMHNYLNSTPCFISEYFPNSVTITFDINTVNVVGDWYPNICGESFVYDQASSSSSPVIIFNNLIIDNMKYVRFSRTQAMTLILNNCSFYNISTFHIYENNSWSAPVSAFTSFTNVLFSNVSMSIHSTSLKISNTVFEHIKGLTSTDSIINIFSPNDTSLDLELYIKNCSIIDASDYNIFIMFDGKNVHSSTRSIYIHNTSFSNISSSYSLIKSSNIQSSTVINIISCKFLHINVGTILVTKGH
eukprot:385833_1